MRIVVLGDRMYGGVSAYSKHDFEICTRLASLGHKMAHIPMGFVNQMGRQVYKDVLVYNSDENNPFGESVAEEDYLDFRADMLITNKEPWVFQQIFKRAINFVPIVPIDHSPVSGQITSRLSYAFKVITISRFGQRELSRFNIPSVYIPLGVRTDIFKPMPKTECRKSWGLDEDAFVVGIVCMNRARKMVVQQLRGYKRFVEQNPEIKTKLFLWSNVMPSRPPADNTQGVADVGVHLLPEIFELGLGDYVNWVKWDDVEKMGGIPDYDPNGKWDMVRLYNSFDVNLLCSGGEGGGLPYLEANACGVPSVYTNYAAAPEYAGSAGVPVNAENYVVIATPGTRYYLADVEGIASALRKLYDADRERLAVRCVKHAERFSWENVVKDYWVPFLADCEKELYPYITKAGMGSWQ